MELPPPWELRDSTRYPGRCYYYNPETQESLWLRPTPYPGSKPTTKWPPILYALQIFIKHSDTAKDEIRKIADEIISGKAKFEEIAKEKSQDERTRDNGGILGWIKIDDMHEKLKEVARRLRPGEMSPPIETQEGFYLILRRG